MVVRNSAWVDERRRETDIQQTGWNYGEQREGSASWGATLAGAYWATVPPTVATCGCTASLVSVFVAPNLFVGRPPDPSARFLAISVPREYHP